jgi:hypothetical protein
MSAPNWRPMTAAPETNDFLSVLIAFIPFEGEAPVLAGQLYTWSPRRRVFLGDDDGEAFSGWGWWVPEREVLAPILDMEGVCRTCIPF